ncbi:MAG: patatin-like phospholipase family protein [Pseudomonadota bacterium]
MERSAFLSFSGGGAAGVIHLGAWYALASARDLKISGACGTSAGALMAALVALGYQPDEIYSPDKTDVGEQPIMNALGVRSLDAIFKLRPVFPGGLAVNIIRFSAKALATTSFALGRLLKKFGGARVSPAEGHGDPPGSALFIKHDYDLLDGFKRPVWLATLLFFSCYAAASLAVFAVAAVCLLGAIILGTGATAVLIVAGHVLVANLIHLLALITARCFETVPFLKDVSRMVAFGVVGLFICAAVVQTIIQPHWVEANHLTLDAVSLLVHLLTLAAAIFAIYRWMTNGLYDIDAMRNSYAKLVERAGLTEDITFKELAAAAQNAPDRPLRPLKVVATNITLRKLQLFSAETTPDVPIVDALAASMAIPVVFRPMNIPSELLTENPAAQGQLCHFLDGGLVSNLPAWSFDEERAFQPESELHALDIDNSPGKHKSGDMVVSAIRTAIFGSHSQNFRGIANLRLHSLKTSHDMLDFRLSHERAVALIAEGQDIVNENIYRRRLLDEVLTFTAHELVEEFRDRFAAQLKGNEPRCIVFGIRSEPFNVTGARSILRPFLVTGDRPLSGIHRISLAAEDGTDVPSPAREAWLSLLGPPNVFENTTDDPNLEPVVAVAVSFHPNYRKELEKLADAGDPIAMRDLRLIGPDVAWSFGAAVPEPIDQGDRKPEKVVFVVDGAGKLRISADEREDIYHFLTDTIEYIYGLLRSEAEGPLAGAPQEEAEWTLK